MTEAIKKRNKLLKQALQHFNLFAFDDYQSYLKELYNFLKAQQPSYSYLLFAEDCGFQPTNFLRLVIIRDRSLNRKHADLMGRIFAFSSAQKKYFSLLVQKDLDKSPDERQKTMQALLSIKRAQAPTELDSKMIRYLSKWLHAVLREIIGAAQEPLTEEQIQELLLFPVRIEEIRDSLQLLRELGYVQYESKTRSYAAPSSMIATANEVDRLAVTSFHQEMLDLANQAMTRIASQDRTINAMTISLDEDGKNRLRGLIDDFVSGVMALDQRAKQGPATVMQVNLQNFPFVRSVEPSSKRASKKRSSP